MKFSTLTLSMAALLIATVACNKREIIPAPEVKIELENSFIGKINGSTVEFTQNVGGYAGSSEADFVINAGGDDRAVYYSTMSSSTDTRSISVGHGSIIFDANASSVPSLDVFNSFYTNAANIQPDFSNGGTAGFRVKFKDAAGREWSSNENHSYPLENAVYTNIRQESDNTGDYSSFRMDFAGYVYRSWTDGVDTYTDSLLITDAIFKGWYKR